MADSHIRAFIALPLPARIKKSLSRIQVQIRQLPGVKASFPPVSNLHLTLVFLGNISCGKLKQLTDIMDAVAALEPKLNLSLASLGTFSARSRSPRVFWAGIGGDVDELKSLFTDLTAELMTEGLALDRQKFSPHITLARFKNNPGHSRISEVIRHHHLAIDPFSVKRVNLYKSELRPRSAVYTLLHESHLGQAA